MALWSILIFIVLASVTTVKGHEGRKVLMQPFGDQIIVEHGKHAVPFGQEIDKHKTDFNEEWKCYYYPGGYTHYPGPYLGPPLPYIWKTHEIQQIWIRNYTDKSNPTKNIHYLLLLVLYDKAVVIGGETVQQEVWSPTLYSKVDEAQNNMKDVYELLPELQHGLPPMPADFQYEESGFGKFFVLHTHGRAFAELKV